MCMKTKGDLAESWATDYVYENTGSYSRNRRRTDYVYENTGG